MSGNPIEIRGVDVRFPFDPYPIQVTYMDRLINALQTGSNALLESPTGTGKTLSLLCGALAWAEHIDANGGQRAPTPDPVGEEEFESPWAKMLFEQNAPLSMVGLEKRPRIYYCSRTHKQLQQVAEELRASGYRPSMAILASRKQYCIHSAVKRAEFILTACRKQRRTPSGCSYHKGAERMSGRLTAGHARNPGVTDIEDLVNQGFLHGGCPYYTARALAKDAELILCPYNYLIDPSIRSVMGIDLEGSVVIIDEAHNIESVCSSVAGFSVSNTGLERALGNLRNFVKGQGIDGDAWSGTIESFAKFIEYCGRVRQNLDTQKHGLGDGVSCVLPDEMRHGLVDCGFTDDRMPVHFAAWSAIQKLALGNPPIKLRDATSRIFKDLLQCLGLLVQSGNAGTHDFRMVLEPDKFKKGRVYTVNIVCLNPAAVFRAIGDACHSVVLTSGTLAPMTSFASELGCKFPVSLENGHVVDLDTQALVRSLGSGPTQPFTFTYSQRTNGRMQDELGNTLVQICKAVPAGVLVFFPSYAVLTTYIQRWRQSRVYRALEEQKDVYQEPRTTDQMEAVIRGYYRSINGSEPGQKRRRGSSQHGRGSVSCGGGGLLLAVCRGKLSEGVDFSDDYARAVVLVGIPFPASRDSRVQLKRAYNDHRAPALIRGGDWYCLQAYRAINQALGRCIRHRNDRGAILLIDSRFSKQTSISSVSRWIRGAIKISEGPGELVRELSAFFGTQSK